MILHATQRPLWAAIVLLVTLPACREGSSPASNETDTPTISWHEGDVQSAFDFAKETDKPLFLYWGAEWCPPCHYLRNKLFDRPEFVERMADFVPVYLDGDTGSAQIWGERLGVTGYRGQQFRDRGAARGCVHVLDRGRRADRDPGPHWGARSSRV